MNHLPNKVSLGGMLFFQFWNICPPAFKKWFCRVYTSMYDASWSRFMIPFYCRMNYKDKDPGYLKLFKPSSNNK